MKRYFKFFITLFTLSLKRDLENRWSVVARLFSSLTSLMMAIFFVEIIFSRVAAIKTWEKFEVLLLMGCCQVMTSIFEFMVRRGVYQLPSYVQNGDLDLILTKPINSQFYISLRQMRFYNLIKALYGVVLVVYSLTALGKDIAPFNWIMLILSLSAGIVILYAIYYLLATLAIWLIQVSALPNLYHLLMEPLSIPLDIMGKTPTFILTFILPLALVITIPVNLLLSKSPLYYLFFSFCFAIGFLRLSVWFWNFSLKKYSSASS